jgi:REP element-mobilizing transposase RayT
VTKYRRGVFTKAVLDDIRGVFASVWTDFEAEFVEFDGEDAASCGGAPIAVIRRYIEQQRTPH